MIWLAVEPDGNEMLFDEKPERYQELDDEDWGSWSRITLKLPKGAIKKLIGRELTWKDEPVNLEAEL